MCKSLSLHIVLLSPDDTEQQTHADSSGTSVVGVLVGKSFDGGNDGAQGVLAFELK